jgi:rhamnogalacturonan endolyase
MRARKWLGALATVAAALLAIEGASAAEDLDRGLVALGQPDGSVYVGWRLLQPDPKDLGFVVERQEGQGKPIALNNTPIRNSTNFVDRTASPGKLYKYSLACIAPGAGPNVQALSLKNSNPVAVLPARSEPPAASSYLSIPLQGDYDVQKATVADLNGDGVLDYVIKQPNFNTDPYQQPGYWKKSEDTYKIEAYDGATRKFLWRYDMGWAIEEGIWYAPIVAYDVDGDGKAEVYCKAGEGDPREITGHVMKGPEYLAKIDGMTGKVVKKIDWPSREGFDDYNYWSRNLLAVAYLDGKKPALICQRGTYKIIKIRAYDGDFNLLWEFVADGQYKECQGQGSHGYNVSDVDGDGRDELVIGSACIDEYGKPMWNTKKGHPDFVYVADIDPGRPGLEVFYGIEPAKKKGGVCLVDARTGAIIWENPEPTKHVHGQGMCADIDPEHPGMECYAKERDTDDSWLYSAKGERLGDKPMGGTSPRAIWWDATPQKALILGRGEITKYKGGKVGAFEGNIVAIADCLGDWREEIVTSVKGELRVYTTTIPATTRRPWLLDDRQYRLGVAIETMGYFYPPQLGMPAAE